MASKVYFADFRCPSWRENLPQKLARLMMTAGNFFCVNPFKRRLAKTLMPIFLYSIANIIFTNYIKIELNYLLYLLCYKKAFVNVIVI